MQNGRISSNLNLNRKRFMADLHFLTAVQLSEKIKSKKISCLEMLDLFLARTEQGNQFDYWPKNIFKKDEIPVAIT